ncbi:GyrI-like domain-containing protein [Imperialibacter roseus]|uniref:GyrI-like domain-containing protein n=1 Tax=Imperialibacter roseus TaxID=1324217 RepID=A0ABZ0ISG5_9BACT|nr:GyrI-like domain-containing protein [Imperialibacter roseus]WOK07982.1 GyrI-like domain-containing protein [Imperialibacter roseus]
MTKIDLSKIDKTYYTAKQKPELVTLAPAQYLSIAGQGDPSSKGFAECIEALYSVAYIIKFDWKAAEKDFVVPKLEGQWWFDEDKYGGVSMTDAPTKIPRSEWMFRLLIRLPEFVEKGNVATAASNVVSKKGMELARQVKYFEMNEGNVVQILHVGPFDKEPESLGKLQGFIEANNLKRNGLHHEIYLSDFRKTAPDKLKTILREPVK